MAHIGGLIPLGEAVGKGTRLMASPYMRRKPSILRNVWVYRRLVMVAVVLGLLLWFVGTNRERVTIAFPFRLGQVSSTTGVIILVSALVGSLATVLVMTVLWAFRARRSPRLDEPDGKERFEDGDLPPANYAAKAGEGLSEL